jgi:hypothetical protein
MINIYIYILSLLCWPSVFGLARLVCSRLSDLFVHIRGFFFRVTHLAFLFLSLFSCAFEFLLIPPSAAPKSLVDGPSSVKNQKNTFSVQRQEICDHKSKNISFSGWPSGRIDSRAIDLHRTKVVRPNNWFESPSREHLYFGAATSLFVPGHMVYK